MQYLRNEVSKYIGNFVPGATMIGLELIIVALKSTGDSYGQQLA
jgi:hypothetical protein